MKNRTVVVMLAVVAVLLGLNLVAPSSPAAGQPHPGPLLPTVVAMTVTTDFADPSGTLYRVYRTWSDGQVDATWLEFDNNPTLCAVANMCGPAVIIPGS